MNRSFFFFKEGGIYSGNISRSAKLEAYGNF